jgi:hypothetical protein
MDSSITTFSNSIPPAYQEENQSTTFNNSIPSADQEENQSTTFNNSIPSADQEENQSTTFNNSIPPAGQEENQPTTFCNSIQPDDQEEYQSTAFCNSIPPADQEEKQPSTSTPSKPRSEGPEKYIARDYLISHVASLLFAIPTLALFAVDLHAYMSQPHPNPYSITNPKRYFRGNPIEILDSIALASLAVAIIYSTTYLVCLYQSIQLISPTTIRQHVIPIVLTEALLAITVQSVSETAISMRTGGSKAGTNCQLLLYLDAGACSTYRCNIIKAAGAMGTVTG